jgi:hypothetical protein
MQYLFRWSDGTIRSYPEPEPQPCQQTNSLWAFVQGLAVVAGLAVSLREIWRWKT